MQRKSSAFQSFIQILECEKQNKGSHVKFRVHKCGCTSYFPQGTVRLFTRFCVAIVKAVIFRGKKIFGVSSVIVFIEPVGSYLYFHEPCWLPI